MIRHVAVIFTELEATEARAAMRYVLELEEGGDGPTGKELAALERAYEKMLAAAGWRNERRNHGA